jgi:hypothetical protein
MPTPLTTLSLNFSESSGFPVPKNNRISSCISRARFRILPWDSRCISVWSYDVLCCAFSQYSVWPQTGRPGFGPRQRQSIFSSASLSGAALRSSQPPMQWILVVRWSFLRGKAQPGRDVDHSPHLVPRSTVFRSCIFSPPCRLHGFYGTVIFSPLLPMLLHIFSNNVLFTDRDFIYCIILMTVMRTYARSPPSTLHRYSVSV